MLIRAGLNRKCELAVSRVTKVFFLRAPVMLREGLVVAPLNIPVAGVGAVGGFCGVTLVGDSVLPNHAVWVAEPPDKV